MAIITVSSSAVCFVITTIISSFIIQGSLAWQELPRTPNFSKQPYRRGHRSVPKHVLFDATGSSSSQPSSSILQESSSMDGVEEFETWFSGIEGSKCNPYIRHNSFGELRGLGTQDQSVGSGSGGSWMTIPRSITLASDFTKTDWDAELAESLWKEVEKGPASPIRGYVSLLTKSKSSWTSTENDSVPPFPAPDALRHWTDTEKEALAIHPDGKALLDLQKRQEQMWRGKYEKLTSSTTMTWDQFEWAMEAVHSRAFCGDFGVGGGLPAAVNVGAPAVAALAGYVYYAPLHGQNDIVLLALAVLGAIPSLINLLQESPPMAVLLPFIDSANHLEEADSSIQYSPLSDSFDLTGGKGCLVKEENGKQQLYISYGKKSDRELLLNYGFLKGASFRNGENESERRQKLAELFVANQQ